MLSLILDDQNAELSPKHWNIFYHLLVDNDSLSIIRTQAEKLSKLSSTIDSWHESTYGPVLRIVSQDTLSQLHSLWQKYFKIDQPEAFNEKFRDGWRSVKAARRDINKKSMNINGIRAQGPLASLKNGNYAYLHFENFWDTGVIGGNSFDKASAQNPNPIFFYTSVGDKFIVHHGTDPALGFHLEMAFADVVGNGPLGEVSGISKSRAKTPQQLADRIAQVAKMQFKEWSKAFKKMATRRKLVIRFYLGDALRFCRSLAIYREKGPDAACFDYAQAWRAAPLKLDGGDYRASSPSPAPTSFDVVETSNLTDHIGLLNILIAATQVLSSQPSSILYTETFVGRGEAHKEELAQLLSGDVVTMSVLLGLAPVGYVTGAIPGSSAQECVGRKKESNRYNRISWKQPMLGDGAALKGLGDQSERCAVGPEELAMVLFRIYHEMFQYESYKKLVEVANTSVNEVALWPYHRWYTRETYAEFLRLVQRRVATDWPRVMEILEEKLIEDRVLDMGARLNRMGGVIDLFTHLHRSGVYKHPKFTQLPLSSSSFLRRFATLPEPSMPDVVTVALIVPRSNFEIFADTRLTLCATIQGDGFWHLFSSVQTVFGKLVHSKGGLEATIIEDTNATDLIVSFSAPTTLLLAQHPSSINVAFRVVPIPLNRLGSELPDLIYESTLSNRDEVAVFREPPSISSWRPSLEAPPSLPFPRVSEGCGAPVSSVTAYFDDAAQVEKFNISVDYPSGTAGNRELWEMSDEPVVSQASPCTFAIIIPGVSQQTVTFPYPVDGSRAQHMLLFKPSWETWSSIKLTPYIEISAPPLKPTERSGVNLKVLPIVNGQPPIVWDIPRVNLDRLPALDVKSPENTNSWLDTHISCMYSDRERQMAMPDIKLNLKHSIASIILKAAGTIGQKSRVFAISSPSHTGPQILIFVDNIRLDLGSRTVVADARVLPVTNSIFCKEERALDVLHEKGIFVLSMEDAELECWREILPTLVERCRSWKHTDFCEYRKRGIPVSTQDGESPLCSCGVGKAPQALEEVDEWKPFEKYWTRAAIAPIFAFPYAESCEMAIKDLQEFKGALKPKKDRSVPMADRRTTRIYERPTKVDKGIPRKYDQAPSAKVDGRAPIVGGIGTPVANTAGPLVSSGLCQSCAKKLPTGTLFGCRKCGKVKYCSAACQKGDKKRHKGVCKK